MDFRTVVAVGLGAALGGVGRLAITQFVVARFGVSAIFYATLFINVSGSFLIGMVLEYLRVRADVHPLWRYFLATGILGGYTTFSTFSFEALAVFTTGTAFSAMLYIVASVSLGILGAILGVAAMRAFAHA